MASYNFWGGGLHQRVMGPLTAPEPALGGFAESSYKIEEVCAVRAFLLMV
jgi:hypothetical protein